MRRENTIQGRITRDEPVFGAGVSTFSPAAIESFGAIGLDFIWLDFEHSGPSPYDSTVLATLTRAAEVSNIDLVVRLPDGSPPLIRKVLDAGVRTILVPRVETAREVREAVEAAKFSIEGSVSDRGIGVGRSSTWGADFDAHTTREDEETFVGVMIENTTAVENIEEILDVRDLGFAFIGPADLSVSAGHPMEKDHPAVQSLVEDAETAIRDSPVALGGIENDSTAIGAAIEDGYRILRIGGDLSAARQTLSDRLAQLNR